jgi:hypothetical protein
MLPLFNLYAQIVSQGTKVAHPKHSFHLLLEHTQLLI